MPSGSTKLFLISRYRRPRSGVSTVNTSAFYVFVNRNSGKAMDLWEWSTADGGQLRQYTRTNATVSFSSPAPPRTRPT